MFFTYRTSLTCSTGSDTHTQYTHPSHSTFLCSHVPLPPSLPIPLHLIPLRPLSTPSSPSSHSLPVLFSLFFLPFFHILSIPWLLLRPSPSLSAYRPLSPLTPSPFFSHSLYTYSLPVLHPLPLLSPSLTTHSILTAALFAA